MYTTSKLNTNIGTLQNLFTEDCMSSNANTARPIENQTPLRPSL